MKRLIKKIIRPLAIRFLLVREWSVSRVVFNPLSPKFMDDPYPTYAKLRRKDPVHWSRLIKSWVLTTHRDVDFVLRDHKRFANDTRNALDQMTENQVNEVHSMLYLDPPDHTRLKSLVSRAFTRKAIEAMNLRIEVIVDQLLDKIEDDKFDAIEALAHPLPNIVVSEMLGIPPEDQTRFRDWSDNVASSLEPNRSQQELQVIEQSLESLHAYFDEVIDKRRTDPQDDLVTVLCQAEEEGEKLTHQELLVTLTLLLVAGNETTKNLIGNGLLALLQNPVQMELLRKDSALVLLAVEELLRFDGPVQMDSRTALEDVEIGGKQIKRGEFMVLVIGSANRDEEVFCDPDSLQINRSEQNHLAFGRGIHHCLGAQLAQLEGQIALRKLLHRFPNIRLAGKPVHNNRVVLRGLTDLPVAIGTRRS